MDSIRYLDTQPCWEYMKCGRDKDGSELKCPAYPYFGRLCWVVAGTFCQGRAQGTFAQKYEDCRKCGFFQRTYKKDMDMDKIRPVRNESIRIYLKPSENEE